MTGQHRYRAEPEAALIVHSLDELTLLYHRPSGQTHMVVSPVPEIIAALREGDADAGEVQARLARDFDLGEPAEAAAQITTHLEEMALLGVVRRL